MILADLTIDGRARKVLMQAPKNGFFYVLDRATGEFISGTPYVTVTWASGLDPKTGRPIEKPEARYSTTGKPLLMQPGPIGGHNWQPMSYSPTTGLVYLPAIEGAFFYMAADPTTSSAGPASSGTPASTRRPRPCPTTKRCGRRSAPPRRGA
jgi:glucose dehydrogenase